MIDLSNCTGPRPQIGEKLFIIPNHTCVVSNLFDMMVFHRGGIVTRVEDVSARGLVWQGSVPPEGELRPYECCLDPPVGTQWACVAT
ncbi:UNVERIFIED_ORG: hypothetical protein GGD58_001725 [Rhizobium pisi]